MTPSEYVAEVESARARRVERLRSERGWLAMVDRVWLEPGDNVTPIGTIAVAEDGALRLAASPAVTRDGLPARDGPVALGDTFEKAGLRYELGRTVDRPSLRVWDPAVPAGRDFAGLTYYPIGAEWRVTARFSPFEAPRTILMPFSSGEAGDRPCPGALHFELAGQACLLLPVVEADPTPRLFVLFGDPTNRDDTYPAGRFLYAPMPEAGQTVLDFNLAMNPACAFNDLVVCPLPPAENRLPVRVEAGERRIARP